MTSQQQQRSRRFTTTHAEDTLFDVLSSERRRRILRALHREGPLELTALAERVAVREMDTGASDLESQERKRVYISCYQTHVPRLVDAGLVNHDTEAGTVTPTARLDDVAAFLGWRTPSGSSYPLLAVSSVAGAFYLGVLLELPGLSTVSPAVAGAIVVGLFFVYGLSTVIR